MLFNSYEFLFFFFPITLGGFLALSGLRYVRLAAAWLALASIFFYGYWSPRYVLLLMGSICFNFMAGQIIQNAVSKSHVKIAKNSLIIALIINLGSLAYFKYANFFVESINTLTDVNWSLNSIILPIGISFFTFTQIAFIVDAYQGKVRESKFIPYVLFVTYFPHLIAGPVLHHAEMMPQFARTETYKFNLNNFLCGAVFFLIGLFKKIIIADGIQPFVAPVFEADPTYALTSIEAWGGALAYTLQLYFDFSGYSDMAIGLSKMFNVNLPLNFNSPYKAINIIDFWRRWHMTLSRFLRDYLYITLGGNRQGTYRRYANLMITMLLGGMWHGAGWTFIVWGGLHGIYLVINNMWGFIVNKYNYKIYIIPNKLSRILSILITFICVVFAWVFFRSLSIDAGLRVISGMLFLNGTVFPNEWKDSIYPITKLINVNFNSLEKFSGTRQLAWITSLLAIVWLFPNTQTVVNRYFSSNGKSLVSTSTTPWIILGAISVLIGLLAAINASHGSSEFIYFNF